MAQKRPIMRTRFQRCRSPKKSRKEGIEIAVVETRRENYSARQELIEFLLQSSGIVGSGEEKALCPYSNSSGNGRCRGALLRRETVGRQKQRRKIYAAADRRICEKARKQPERRRS